MTKKNTGCLFGFLDIFSTKPRNAPKKGSVSSEFLPAYKRKYLLTQNELYFYKELKRIADKYNLSVLAKIRMADLVEPKSKGKAYYNEFAKIKAKHVDFALCSPTNLYVVLLIELDDNSHNSSKNAQRDSFVELVYQMTGYKLYRARGTANLEKDIVRMLEIKA